MAGGLPCVTAALVLNGLLQSEGLRVSRRSAAVRAGKTEASCPGAADGTLLESRSVARLQRSGTPSAITNPKHSSTDPLAHEAERRGCYLEL